MRTLSIWLITIILLTLVSFLSVFQPITFTARKDPSDSTKYLKPVGAENFSPDKIPTPTTQLGKSTNVYIYVPQSDIRLGLDLRGGMRVVLEILDHAEFKYQLTKTYPSDDKDKMLEMIGQKNGALTDAIKKELGGILPEGTDIYVDYSLDKGTQKYTVSLQITTYPKDSMETAQQFSAIKTAMNTVFGETGYTISKESATPEMAYKQVDKDTQDQTRFILEQRVNPDGTKEINSYNQGNNQIVLEIPGERDPDHVRELLGKTANLTFHILAEDVHVSSNPENDKTVNITRNGTEISSEEALKDAIYALRGRDIKANSCRLVPDTDHPGTGKYAVTFSVKSEVVSEFADLTERYSDKMLGTNKGRLMAIVLDNVITSAPQIKDRLEGGVRITGGFDEREANDLKTLLNAGAISSPVKIVENRTVSPTLGADSVSMSLTAGLIGLLIVLIFMAGYYRLPGLMADLALMVYVFLVLMVMWLFPSFTLTCPGIAGVIISIGMAVDANVIIFERLKEELRAKRPVETAIDVAFARAWTAILDSNIASIITGTVLYWLGTGAVQMFAVTLLIGVIVSLFTAVTVTRLFMKLLIRTKIGHQLAAYGI